MSSSPSNASKTGSVPNAQLSSRLYALLRSEKAQGTASVTPSAITPVQPLGGYSGLPASFGFGQPHPLVAAAAQAALSGSTSQEFQIQKFEDLQSALNQLRRYADSLPGGQYSPEEQIRYTAILREQVRVKSELLNKFKQLGASGLLEETSTSVAAAATKED